MYRRCRSGHALWVDTHLSGSKKGGRPSVRLTGGSLSLRTVSFCRGIFLQESLLRHPRPNLVTRWLSNIPEILQSGAGITFHRGSQHNQPTKELVTGTGTIYTSNIHHRVFTTIQFFRLLSIIYGQILPKNCIFLAVHWHWLALSEVWR